MPCFDPCNPRKMSPPITTTTWTPEVSHFLDLRGDLVQGVGIQTVPTFRPQDFPAEFQEDTSGLGVAGGVGIRSCVRGVSGEWLARVTSLPSNRTMVPSNGKPPYLQIAKSV